MEYYFDFWELILIDKLYNLKKNQTNQRLMEKSQLESQIEKIEHEITLTKNRMDSATVEKFGAISDFTILTMHKNTMKMHIEKLNTQKKTLVLQVENLVKDIIELQKESEQFKYILEEEKKEALIKILKEEEEASTEYMQSKYINS